MGEDAGERRGGRRAGRAVTMRDVAELAGVSSMTVSHVLNGTKNVHEATRAAVLAAVERLDYSPNQAARSLASAEPTRIAVAHINADTGYLSGLLMGALNAGARRAVQLSAHRLQLEPGEAPGEALAALVAAGVDGLLLPAPLGELADADPRTVGLGVPIVAHAPGDRLTHLSAVRIDQPAAAAAMTEHLLSLGHRRIGFVTGPPHRSASRGRLAGHRAALAAAGVADDPALIVEGAFTFPSGMAAVERLLDLAQPPTAIFAANDAMAAGVLAAAHRRGVATPGDLSVAGFDDDPLAQVVWPALTTVQQPISEMASTAVELLVAELRARRSGAAPERVEHMAPHALVIRDSAGPPRR